MGTSLSGLTPATTFDGLLKTSDNEPLDGTLKAISTGEGTDTILQLSNSALSIGGDTSVSGGVNTSASNALTIQNSDGTQLFAVRNDGRLLLGTSSNLMYLDDALLQTWQINNSYFSGQRVGIGVNASGSYRLHIKGSGATSATASLLVQNSAGTDMFKVTDDGVIQAQNLKINASSTLPLLYAENSTAKSLQLGNQAHLSAFDTIDFKTWDGSAYSEAMRITGNTDQFVGIGETTPTARLHVKGSGNTDATSSLIVQNSDGDEMLNIEDDNNITMGPNGAFMVNANSKIYTKGDGFLWRTSSDSYIATMTSAGLQIGNSSANATARLQVKGSGATSATTALLVENSAGTDLLKVEDGGNINLGTGRTYAGEIWTSSYLRVSGGNLLLNGNQIYTGNTGNGFIQLTSNNLEYSDTATSGKEESAALTLTSTTRGFLPPRMTTTQRDAITSPASGLMVYNTTTNKAQCYNGTTWNDLF